MALGKKMAHDDSCGNSHSQSYWRLGTLDIDNRKKVARVVFYGFKDQAAFDAGLEPIGKKAYIVRDAAYEDLLAQHLATGGPNILQLAWSNAVNTADTPDPANPAIMRSFFYGAVDV